MENPIIENQTIQATLRGKQTHRELTHMRNSGQTAVSLSERGMAPISLYMATAELESALLSKPSADTRINLGLEGASHLTRFAKVDRHPISRELLTVSLQKVAAE